MGLFDARENTDYRAEIKKAYDDWRGAQNYFENVSDPELIDFAIYDLEAAKRRYVYMLRKVRTETDLDDPAGY
jgi:hypothetical protein